MTPMAIVEDYSRERVVVVVEYRLPSVDVSIVATVSEDPCVVLLPTICWS